MPKTIYVSKHTNSGIDITWTKSAQRLDIGGWYDGCVGIEGRSFKLREFFDEMGITLKDCQKVFRGE